MFFFIYIKKTKMLYISWLCLLRSPGNNLKDGKSAEASPDQHNQPVSAEKNVLQMKFSLALGIQIFLFAEGNPQDRTS